MDPLFAFRNPEQIRAYTEAAMIVSAKAGEVHLTDRVIVENFSPESRQFVQELGCGPDETCRDTFMDDLHRYDVLQYRQDDEIYYLGKLGTILLVNFMEEWAGTP